MVRPLKRLLLVQEIRIALTTGRHQDCVLRPRVKYISSSSSLDSGGYIIVIQLQRIFLLLRDVKHHRYHATTNILTKEDTDTRVRLLLCDLKYQLLGMNLPFCHILESLCNSIQSPHHLNWVSTNLPVRKQFRYPRTPFLAPLLVL
jgi:hypothetical protein